MRETLCWVVTEGMAGTENQCLGVAESLGLDPVVKRIGLRQPWKTLTPFIGMETKGTFDPPLEAPWPDLLIAAGRKSIAASRYVKRMSGGETFTVQIQDPKTSPAQFDLVAVPVHDSLRGPNVIVTDGTPNRITAETLDAARERFAPLFAPLPSPRIGVVIGGSSRTHRLSVERARAIASRILSLNTSVMATASRRTEGECRDVFKDAFNTPATWFWDGAGENPYLGILAWADVVMVTEDSASMLSDAGTAGKPVYIIKLDGRSERFDRLHRHLIEKGVARFFDGMVETWKYPPLRDSEKIAQTIRQKMGQSALYP